MAKQDRRHVLLTGAPGSGKTTVVLAVLQMLREAGRPTFGFWTEEVRHRGARRGFALELASGSREMLASVELPGPARVGRYGVNVEAMDRLVVPEIERGLAAAEQGEAAVIVMDEIGKMELLSKAFQQAIVGAFSSPAQVLATIMARPHPLADSLKARCDAVLFSVLPKNREGLPGEIAAVLGLS